MLIFVLNFDVVAVAKDSDTRDSPVAQRIINRTSSPITIKSLTSSFLPLNTNTPNSSPTNSPNNSPIVNSPGSPATAAAAARLNTSPVSDNGSPAANVQKKVRHARRNAAITSRTPCSCFTLQPGLIGLVDYPDDEDDDEEEDSPASSAASSAAAPAASTVTAATNTANSSKTVTSHSDSNNAAGDAVRSLNATTDCSSLSVEAPDAKRQRLST